MKATQTHVEVRIKVSAKTNDIINQLWERSKRFYPDTSRADFLRDLLRQGIESERCFEYEGEGEE